MVQRQETAECNETGTTSAGALMTLTISRVSVCDDDDDDVWYRDKRQLSVMRLVHHQVL